MVVRTEVNLRQRTIMAVVAINAGVFVTGADVQLIVSRVIDTAKITDLAAVRPTAIVAVIANGTVVAPRHTERNVHALIRPVVILVAVASQGNAHITNAAHIEIVGEHDVVVCLLLTIPVGMAGIVEINRNTRIAEVLVISGGVHLFVVARTDHFAVTGIQILAHGHKVLFREAISSESDAAVELVKVFGITHTEGVTVQRTFAISGVFIQFGMRMSNIKRDRAEGRQIATDAQRRRLIVFITQRTAI